MANDINALRAVLFDTLRGLKDGSLDTDKARAINDTAQVIINSAKVEVAYLEKVGGNGTGFISAERPRIAAEKPNAGIALLAVGRDL